MTSEVLAIIPARGGSRGIPRKNLHSLAGRPLLSYTIEAGQKARSIDAVVVTTEDPEITGVAEADGVEVVARPPGLAQDDTPTLPVLQHALTVWENDWRRPRPRLVVTLQPTSPLRTWRHIDDAIGLLTDEWDSVVSVCEMDHSPYKAYRVVGDELVPLLADADPGRPRQALPAVYRENGAIYVSPTSLLLASRASIRGERIRPYIMDRMDSVDIDTELDLRIAEILLNERNRKLRDEHI